MILLLFPYLFIFGAICALCLWSAGYWITTHPVFHFVIVPNEMAVPIEDDISEPIVIAPDTTVPPVEIETETEPVTEEFTTEPETEVVTQPETEPVKSPEVGTQTKYPGIWRNSSTPFPTIYYETQWATLNVEGWERKNIPVYFGDSKKILVYGAGQWIGSRFCGQNGKTVLSAHVTSHFYEIEDTEIGDIITMDTVYGSYAYKVTDIVIFDYTDPSLLLPEDGKDVLVMYTCYPRVNGFDFKTERMALVAEMVSGCQWGAFYDK